MPRPHTRAARTLATSLLACIFVAPSARAQAVLGGSSSPYAIRTGCTLHMEATVLPTDDCTITSVRVLAMAIGNSTINLADDGVHDDGIAGNNTWGADVIVGDGPAWGAVLLPIIASDECGNTSSEGPALAAHVMQDCDWSEVVDAGIDAGELPASAQSVGRIASVPGAACTLWGMLDRPTGRDVDMFRVRACDANAPSRFIVQHASTDIELFLFDASGHGVAHHDGLTTDLIAASVEAQLTPGQDYFIAISSHDRDPLGAGNLPIWLDEPRATQHAPDGPGAALPVVAWGGLPIPTTAIYNIITHNVCAAIVACDTIDFNHDGLFPDTQDLDDFLSVFAGNLCIGQQPDSPACNTDIDFNNDGLFPDTQDIDALLSVFAGNACS